MNEDYVDYQTALALKKAGFNYPCHFYYTHKDAPDDHVWSTTSEEAPVDYNRSACRIPHPLPPMLYAHSQACYRVFLLST